MSRDFGCEKWFSGALMRFLELTDGRLSPAMAMKYGYDSVEEYRNGAQKKFSLLENGILDKPSTRLLLVNVGFTLFDFVRFQLT